MILATVANCSPDEIDRNATCLLKHLAMVRYELRQKGYSAHAIELAVTAVYQAAMPYITGQKPCYITHRSAWVRKVAARAAWRAAMQEVNCHHVEPTALTGLAVTAPTSECRKASFDLREALSRLTAQQRRAVELCILDGQSIRQAAKCMSISAGTLCSHLKAGKERLKAILAEHEPQCRSA